MELVLAVSDDPWLRMRADRLREAYMLSHLRLLGMRPGVLVVRKDGK